MTSCFHELHRLTDATGLNQQTTQTYDALNRLITIDYDAQGSANAAHPSGYEGAGCAGAALDYTYDAANNIESILDNINPARDQSLTYDGLSRLDTADSPVYGTLDYGYDANGNRTSKSDGVQTELYTYDPASHHLTQTDNGVVRNYGYDAVGNTTSNPDHGFVYGDNNRLREAQVNTIPLASYTYNGRGERIKKTTGTETTLYYYDQGGQLIAELDATGTPVKEYVYLEGMPLAIIEPDPAAPV